MATEQTLLARARVLEAELNKTLAALVKKGVTVEHYTFGVKGLDGAEGERLEFKFSRITKVAL